MHSFLRDVVGGYRALRATPAAALAAILTIALGTGVNTGVFAVAYGVLHRPLPCPEQSRIVVVAVRAPTGIEVGMPLTAIEDWQRRVSSFEATGAYNVAELTMRGMGEPQLVRTGIVTPSFFDVLRVPPRAGRAPSASDADRWMVLGSRLLRQRARQGTGDDDLLGSSMTAGDRSFQVLTVMPPDFGFPADEVAAWVPAAAFRTIRLGSGRDISRRFQLIARLKDDVSIQQARDDARRALSEVPEIDRDNKEIAEVRPIDDVLFGKVRPALNALVAAALLVLLVACANVAVLLVNRAAARNRDLAVRLSLGASAWQLGRAALAESLLIAAAGSALGIGLALACVRVFVRAAAGVIPRVDAIAIDGPVLGATLLVGVGVTLVCGLAPVIYAIRSDAVPALRGSRATVSRSVRLTRRVLVVAQITMSIVLLSGAGLIARSVFALLSDGAGADPDHALVAKVVLADSPRLDLASRMPTIREVLRRVRTLPGVDHAAFGTNIPPRVSQISFSVQETSNGRSTTYMVHLVSVTSDFFAALGTKVLEGHAIDETDEQRDGPVIVLSASAARLLSPGKSLVGRELPWPLPAGAGKGRKPLVAGVVDDVKYGGLDAPAFAAIYTRWTDLPSSVSNLVVRASGDPALLAATVRKTIAEVDPSLPVSDVRTLRQEYSSSIADRRIRLVPAAGFAVLAFAVALVGLGGLLARAATERRRELAIRCVLGASPADAVGIMVREGALLAAAGVVLGFGAAAIAATWLQSILYGVSPLDPLTHVAVALVVSAAAVVTSFLSARRVARIDPLELLRSE